MSSHRKPNNYKLSIDNNSVACLVNTNWGHWFLVNLSVTKMTVTSSKTIVPLVYAIIVTTKSQWGISVSTQGSWKVLAASSSESTIETKYKVQESSLKGAFVYWAGLTTFLKVLAPSCIFSILYHTHLHDTEVDLSLREWEERTDKLCANVHLHDSLLTSAGANNSMTKHALFHCLWPGKKKKVALIGHTKKKRFKIIFKNIDRRRVFHLNGQSLGAQTENARCQYVFRLEKGGSNKSIWQGRSKVACRRVHC